MTKDFALLPEIRGSDFELTRRELLKALGGGILALAIAPDAWAMGWTQRGRQIPQHISAWVHIGENGKVTVFSGKAEVGQNVRTSLTQAVAEELYLPVENVAVLLADTDLVPYDMGTFGSRSTPTMVPQVRKAAAACREALIDLAAEKWNAPRANLTARNGTVSSGSSSATYGELAKGQPIDRPIAADTALIPASDWKVLGQSVPKVSGRDIVIGEHRYSSDMRVKGMLYGKVLRAPSYGANLNSVDTKGAAAIPEVKVVRDGDFVAVAAPTLRQAEAALALLKADWQEQPGPSSADVFKLLRGAAPAPQAPAAPAAVKLKGTYTCPYIAHVPLEPRAAFAEWNGKKLTVHTGTQRPFAVRDEVAKATGLPVAQVRVIVPDTGSGYGGKHTGEAAVEAARIAKATGEPTKVVWTRNEEFTWAYFRPAGVVEISSGVQGDGRLAYWLHDNYNSGGAAVQTPYEVSEPHCEFHDADSPLRQGSYRSLAACFNNFARETHMDELAQAAGIDPLEFRLKNLQNERLKAVLQAAAERFGWKSRGANGQGFGLSCGTEKGSCVATCAEVSVENGQIHVVRQTTAFECGAILNPDLLKNQVEGAVIMGLGGALFEAIDFADGRILNAHLAHYRVPRYKDVPVMETVLLDRKDLPSAGAGETPIIGIAPAVGNAVFGATGRRLRDMPLKLA